MRPKISIIIPVYNVEVYLRQCLDSVVNQTFPDIQVLCVNDGSTDGSRAILQEYVDRDSRIKVIDKSNGGLSSARNAAYPYIEGKYTLFVDSDDWIASHLCEKTLYKAEETNASITVFFDQRRTKRVIQSITSNDRNTIEEKLPLLDFPTVWSKLWRTDFLLGNKLYFPEGLVYEDNLLNWQAVTLADRIAVVPERLYHYRRNFDSTTQTWGEHSMDMIPIYNKIQEYLLECGYYTTYRDKFISMKLDVWYRHYRNLPVSLKPRFVAMIRDSLTADDREFYRSVPKNPCKQLARLFYAMIEGSETDARKFKIAYTVHQIIRTPELCLNRWIIRPIKRGLGGE